MYNLKKTWDDNDIAPIYCLYPGQNQPQGAYLEIDCENRNIRFAYNPEIGNAVPFAVWHGRTRRYTCDKYLSSAQLNQIVSDAVFNDLVERILNGYSSDYDRNANLCGGLNEDASAAEDEMEEYLRVIEGEDSASDVGDWITFLYYSNEGKCVNQRWDSFTSITIDGTDYTITAKTTDDEIAAITKEIEEAARFEHVYLDGNVEELLKQKRGECEAQELEGES